MPYLLVQVMRKSVRWWRLCTIFATSRWTCSKYLPSEAGGAHRYIECVLLCSLCSSCFVYVFCTVTYNVDVRFTNCGASDLSFLQSVQELACHWHCVVQIVSFAKLLQNCLLRLCADLVVYMVLLFISQIVALAITIVMYVYWRLWYFSSQILYTITFESKNMIDNVNCTPGDCTWMDVPERAPFLMSLGVLLALNVISVTRMVRVGYRILHPVC